MSYDLRQNTRKGAYIDTGVPRGIIALQPYSKANAYAHTKGCMKQSHSYKIIVS